MSFLYLIFIDGQSAKAVLAAEPDTQTVSISAVSNVCNEIDLTFVPGNGSRRIVVASASSPVTSFPGDGHSYTAGSLFGSGSDLGNGNYVVYNQSGNSVSVTGLQGGVQYYFTVFEYNGTSTGSNYLIPNHPETNAVALGFSMTISATPPSICRGDSSRLLATGASIYQWNTSATLSSDTDSAVWSKPSFSTVYSVTGTDTSTGCTNTKNLTVTVYQLPGVSIGSFSNRCVNSAPFNLTSGFPSGGIYSGNGVINNAFYPSSAGVGQHVITYTYTDIHSCSNYDTSNISVISAPAVTIAAISDVCIDSPPLLLNQGSPSGGSYSGTGVSAGQFRPAVAGAGLHLIRYVYTSPAGCTDTAITYINVRPLPGVVFATLSSICLNTPPLTLTQGTPSGGTYTGNGVSNNQFSPLVTGAGTYLITYTYTDSFGCRSSDTSYLTVHTIPAVSFSSLSSVCQNTGPVTLAGGSPPGGVYSGTAVGSGIFYSGIAGQGQHTVTYTYTDTYNCTNNASQTITVNPVPDPNLGPDVTVCSDQTAQLNPGSFSTYYWSTGANSSSINVDTTGRGPGTFRFMVTVSNSFGCANRDTIDVTFDPCSGVPRIPDEAGANVFYPNPSTSGFVFYTAGKFDLEVFDIRGTLILQTKSVTGNFSFGNDLSSGIYLAILKTGSEITRHLLIKN